MPKFGIHSIVLEKLISQQTSGIMKGPSTGPLNSSFRSILTDSSDGLPKAAAYLGAIGPDFFFFSDEYPGFDLLLNVYRKLDGIYGIWRKITQPVRFFEELLDPVNHIEGLTQVLDKQIDTVTGGHVDLEMCTKYMSYIQDARDSISEMKGQLGLMAQVDAALLGINLFSNASDLPNLAGLVFEKLFTPAMQIGKPRENWMWFDILHYRRTGEFAKKLVYRANLEGDPDVQAYAYGYLTHIATDLVGHEYVNEIVGGPYRTHVWRHVTVENFMDSWASKKYLGRDINCGIIDWLKVGKLGNDVDGFIGKYDTKLTKVLVETFESTYGPFYPKRPDKNYLDQCFRNFYTSLELMSDCIRPPEHPFEDWWDHMKGKLPSHPPPNPPEIPNACSLDRILAGDRDCWDGFVEHMQEVLAYTMEFIKWAFDSALAILDFLINLGCTATFGTAAGAMYLALSTVYQVYAMLRGVMEDHGFVWPNPARIMGTSRIDNLVMQNATPLVPYSSSPAIYPSRYLSREGMKNLYPAWKDQLLETPRTYAPFISASNTPRNFIEGYPFREAVLATYASRRNPGATVEYAMTGQNPGNAVDISKYMIENSNNTSKTMTVYCNWNLDADRCFGQKTWEAIISATKVLGQKYVIN